MQLAHCAGSLKSNAVHFVTYLFDASEKPTNVKYNSDFGTYVVDAASIDNGCLLPRGTHLLPTPTYILNNLWGMTNDTFCEYVSKGFKSHRNTATGNAPQLFASVKQIKRVFLEHTYERGKQNIVTLPGGIAVDLTLQCYHKHLKT